MATRGKKPAVDERAMRALLQRYGCPIPYHRVRARFMGNIATPSMNAAPVQEIRRIWNDALPVFDDHKEAEAFFGALLQGLWNGLGAHQKRTDPFKLVRVKPAPIGHAYLGRLAAVRREELDGLFAGQAEMDFPESAHHAICALGELRALFAATEDLAGNPPGPTEVASLEKTAQHLRELARIAEAEINTIIQSCRKARQQRLETYVVDKPGTLH